MLESLRRLLAEFVGTFVLVFSGTGAIIINELYNGELSHLGISMVFGLAIASGVFAVRHISGAHFNPAISLALALIGRFRFREIPLYIGAQLSGALIASLILRGVFGNVAGLGATIPSISLWKAFAIELALTAFLALVIARVASEPGLSPFAAAAAIGTAVALGALLGGPVTGGSMNPARSFAPALASLRFEDHWLYWLAPASGATVGAVTFRISNR